MRWGAGTRDSGAANLRCGLPEAFPRMYLASTDEGVDAGGWPTMFTATTVNVYAVPVVRAPPRPAAIAPDRH